MTRGEIYLVLSMLAALLLGAIVQWQRGREPLPAPAAGPGQKAGWAKPPYVFEARKDLEAAEVELKKDAPEVAGEKK